MSDKEENQKNEQPVKKVKKPNAWIDHVKKVAEEKNIPYREALKIAGETYKK